jgi:hypothetical protein
MAADARAPLGDHNVDAIVFPTHITSTFQALDLLLFSAIKIRKRTAQRDFGYHTVNNHITKALLSRPLRRFA